MTRSAVSAWANADLWDREYEELHSIPSSLRLTPSRAFQQLEEHLPVAPGVAVLDAGCGTGRHSLYLAEVGCLVHAVDASGAACEVLKARLSSRPELESSVRVEQASLGLNDLPGDRYDLIIDSYVSCHLLDDAERRRYLDALLTLLKPGGRLYSSYMGATDTYYGMHLTGTASGLPIATDPLNSVTKLLQKKTELSQRLADLATVAATACERFVDVVAAQPHDREVLAAILHR